MRIDRDSLTPTAHPNAERIEWAKAHGADAELITALSTQASLTPHPDYSTYSDARLNQAELLLDEEIRWAREDGDRLKVVHLEVRMRSLQAEKRRRNGQGYRNEQLEEVHHVSNLPTFPEAAWSGLFGEWRDVVAPCTEAPLENLWGAFLVAVGLMLGRNVWKESPRPLYPNFYMLLLGQTGDSRKSTVLWLAGELLRHVGEDTEILTGIVSTEGLFERLAKKEGTRALGYADEFRSLLSVAKRKGTQDILPKLNSLYSCPEREGIDRREKSTTVIRPFFSLITATAQEYVEDLLSNLEIAGGTLNRFLIISGEEQPPKPNVKSPSPEAWESIAAPLRKIRDRWATTPQHMEWHPEAEELWKDFYTGWRNVRKGWNAREANLTARVFEHVLKISVVYSALGGEQRISAKSLARAISIGEWLQGSVLRIFGDVGLDRFTKAEKAILDIVKERGRLYRRDLQQLLSKKVNGELFGRALKTLEANGFVKLGEETTAAGQKRPWIEYVTTNTQHLTSSGIKERVLGVGNASPGGEL